MGIHSRRTDHVNYSIERLNLRPLAPSYYLDAMEIFKQKFPKKKYNLAFVYVSDEMEWGRQTIGSKKGGKGIFFIGEESEVKSPYDLALLANCNHTIQSYGSFTFYAGFFAGGATVIPQHFAQYRTSIETQKSKILTENPIEHRLPRLPFHHLLE